MITDNFVHFYDMLQVSPNGTDEEIRTAVRKHLRVWVKRQTDADEHRRTEADATVQKINNAAWTLHDADRRLAYDEQLRSYRQPESGFDVRGGDDWRDQAFTHLDQGNIREAYKAACRATAKRESDDVAWYLRGHASFLMGCAQDAEDDLIKAIQIMPREAKYHFDLGDVYALQERWADAAHAFNTALRIEPDNPQYQTALAYAHCEAGQPATAQKIMTELVEEHSDEPFRYYLALASCGTVLQRVSRTPGRLTLRTAQEITLVERQIRWLEELDLTNADGHYLKDELHRLVAEARRPQWVPSQNLAYYLPTLLVLLIVPFLIGNGTVIFFGLATAAGVIAVYVARHRKETWQLDSAGTR